MNNPIGQRSRLSARAAFGLCAASLWMTLYPYLGIVDDGILYTMQGLAHARPDLYSNDLYLRFGSQDRFTLFGSIYGLAIKTFGIEPAAVILTLLLQFALIAGAWQLARRLMSRDLALLAVALLLTINPPYGAQGMFHVFEPFVSPRPLAEALVLGGTAALIAERHTLALSLYGLAAVFHPIMACAGLGLWVWMRAVRPHPRASAMFALAVIGVSIGAACAVPASIIRIDDTWLQFIRHCVPYLELSSWTIWDWNRLGLSLAVLTTGALLLTDRPLRTLMIAASVVVVAGILATAITADWLHVKYLTQGQFWRCEWLAFTLATLSLPRLIARLWSGGRIGRAILSLIAAAYCLQDSPYCVPIAVIAVAVAAGTAWGGSEHLPPRTQRLLLTGTLGLLLVGALWNVANGFLSAHHPLEPSAGPAFAARFRSLADGSLIGPVLLAVAWWFSVHRSTPIPVSVTAAVGLLTVALVMPSAVAAWTHVTYPTTLVGAFDPWRHKIPVGAEVLFPGSPLKAWILLQRPSYIATEQQTSGIFSREAAMVVGERLHQYNVNTGTDARGELKLFGSMSLANVCARSSVRYIATHAVLDATPLETVPADVGRPVAELKLYQCPDRQTP